MKIDTASSQDAGAEGVDQLGHRGAAADPVGVAVGGDHVLVDVPADLELQVLLGREQRAEPRLLLGGEQVGAGVQGPPAGVERVTSAAAVPGAAR